MPNVETIFDRAGAERLANHLVGLPMPFTVTVKDGKPRSLPQNALLHKWFGEIAAQDGDKDAKEVKGICHHEYGLDIRLRDAQWAWVWNNSAGHLSYEKQCAVLASGVLNVSSGMSGPELKEYMDVMNRDYTQRGVRLTQPEAKA